MIQTIKMHLRQCIQLLDSEDTYSDKNGVLIWVKCTLKSILVILEDNNAI